MGIGDWGLGPPNPQPPIPVSPHCSQRVQDDGDIDPLLQQCAGFALMRSQQNAILREILDIVDLHPAGDTPDDGGPFVI